MTRGRIFAVGALLLNGAMAGALTTALVFGIRPVTVLDTLVVITLVVGLLGAVAVVLEAPLRDSMEVTTASGPDEIVSKAPGGEVHFGITGDQRATPIRATKPHAELPAAVEDLDAFLPERPQRQLR